MVKLCPICSRSDRFTILNQETADYSLIEVSICRDMLRVRTYPEGLDKNFDSQEIIKINYCPICGEKLYADSKVGFHTPSFTFCRECVHSYEDEDTEGDMIMYCRNHKNEDCIDKVVLPTDFCSDGAAKL